MSNAIAVAATGGVLVFGLLTGRSTRLQASVGLDDRGYVLLPFDIDRDAYPST